MFSLKMTKKYIEYQSFVGKIIERLTIHGLFRNSESNNDLFYLCDCSCGNKNIHIRAYSIIHQNIKSCGCLRREINLIACKKHGLSKHSLFQIWTAMMQRCYNSNNKGYKYYGERGIKVCERWHTVENFISDLSPRPDSLELDRIDNNGDYNPENCRWTTHKQQMNNFRRNRWIEFNGEKNTLTTWARKIGIRENALIYRLDVAKWSLEKALTTPNREQKIKI